MHEQCGLSRRVELWATCRFRYVGCDHNTHLIVQSIHAYSHNIIMTIRVYTLNERWWRGTVVERRSLAGELSLSCARPAADG